MRLQESESLGTPTPLVSATQQTTGQDPQLLSFVRYMADLEKTHDFLSVEMASSEEVCGQQGID